jgi:hypothetical protein
MLPFYLACVLGTLNIVTVGSFIFSKQLVVGSIILRYMKLILGLYLPLKVYA